MPLSIAIVLTPPLPYTSREEVTTMTNAEKKAVPIMCCVPNCENHPWAGSGEFLELGTVRLWMCTPCLKFVFDNEGEHSAVYHNAIDKSKCKVPNVSAKEKEDKTA